MEEKKVIKKENVVSLYESRFLKVFDLQYEPGAHYFDATRRDKDNIVATKSTEEIKSMLPDAVSCVLVINIAGQEPLLALTKEYRFPTGQFLLSVPAGLIDDGDDSENDNLTQYGPIINAAKREIFEETGIIVEDRDTVKMINPLVFSTPGMTDESNALVKVVLNRDAMPKMSQEGLVGGECFDGFILVNKEEALRILKAGVDDSGMFYSVYTWMALMCFVTDIF